MSENRLISYPERLTRAGLFLADMLENEGRPVLSSYELFNIISKMYAQSSGGKLYLRDDVATEDHYNRLRLTLKKNGFIGTDKDYGNRLIRVLTVSDMPAENIVCMADRTCYVSHLSAMQRWGLTDRNPSALIITRPDRNTAKMILQEFMDANAKENEPHPFPLKIISHPKKVRRRPISLLETKMYGSFVTNRSDGVRLSTIEQTFLDMLQKPELCGGMSHVLDVWDEHAKTYAKVIVEAVDSASSDLVKSRAGYILEERLGISTPIIESWKALGQRGGSRLLDPSKEFAPTVSETWMISLNV